MWVVLLSWACALGVSTGIEGESRIRDSEAIETYLATSYQFTSPLNREAALKGGVQPVEAWPFLARLRHHRLYSFPTSIGTPFTFSLVVVDDQGQVTLLEDARDFNKILATESIRTLNLVEALDLAQTFLRIQNFNVYKTEGLDLGVHVVNSAADIVYPEGTAGLPQQQRIAEECQIAPPGWRGLTGHITTYSMRGGRSEGP